MQEMLRQRRQTQLGERRAQRRNERNNCKGAVRATTLQELDSVTSRAGFLRQQLKATQLTPLRRWHLQLKLLEAEDQVDGDVETVLARSKRCFDVVYREGARVADARESVLEAAPADVKEVLSFSTTVDGCVCRVTCINTSTVTTFTSSLYVANLHPTLLNLLHTQPVITAITYLQQ